MQRRTRRSPFVSSVDALRGLAVGITMLSLAGMTVYAGGHLRNDAAPLQPAAAATPAPASSATAAASTTTGRLRLSVGVATSTKRPVTTTHHS